MGKGTDKLYITHAEWASSDGYSASTGARAGAAAVQAQRAAATTAFQRLPFNVCAASLQPWRDAVCTAAGTVFDVEVIGAWLARHPTNPLDGTPLHARDLIRLDFARGGGDGGDGSGGSGSSGSDLVDPVTYKPFTEHTHIVAVRHGTYANAFAWDTIERLNVKPRMWRDLVDDQPFTRDDLITLQDPRDVATRDHVLASRTGAGGREQQAQDSKTVPQLPADTNTDGRLVRARAAALKARNHRVAGHDVNQAASTAAAAAAARPHDGGAEDVDHDSIRPRPQQTRTLVQASSSSSTAAGKPAGKTAPMDRAAVFTTGRAAASFTSTGLTPETSAARAVLTEEEYLLQPRRVKLKGYARLETSAGVMTVELHTESAPRAVWNFVRLAQRGYYDGVGFHRNIAGFMLQGGDPSGTGRGGDSVWGGYFADELGGAHTHAARGVLSMANKGRNTNSSQFFVTYAPAPHLDRKHTVFGRVIDGLDVLDGLEAAPVDPATHRPDPPLRIDRAVVFVDPFQQFLDQQPTTTPATASPAAAAAAAEDAYTTWTGKRIRSLATSDHSAAPSAVGKYLRRPGGADGPNEATPEEKVDEQDEAEDWAELARKKKKARPGGGFGDFDGW